MKKHILVISQYFYPEQFRINDICTEWIDRGYQVTVVTGIPNYPQGKFFPGYGYLKKRKEQYNGINIVRLPILPRGNRSFMLFLNYISFVVSGFFWSLFTRIDADYIFMFEVSPMTQALLGVWYKRRKKIPCYLYVQDLWPENVALMTGIKNSFILNSIGKMVDHIYRHCDRIFVTSNSFVDAIASRGVPKSKIDFWPQYAETFYHPIADDQKKSLPIPQDSKLNIVYAGNIGQFQELDILVTVAKKLEQLGYGKKIRFNMIGDGRSKTSLLKEISKNEIDYMFNFIDRQPAQEIPYYMALCDIAYLSLKNDPISNMTIPAKVQSYLACGMPIIAVAEGETHDLIVESQSGLCFTHEDIDGLIDSLIELVNTDGRQLAVWGHNSLEYHREHFQRSALMDYIQQYFS